MKKYLNHNLIVLSLFLFGFMLYLVSNSFLQKNVIIIGVLVIFLLLNFLYHKSQGKLTLSIFLEYILIVSLVYLIFLFLNLY